MPTPSCPGMNTRSTMANLTSWLRAVFGTTLVRIRPLPRWCDPQRTARHAQACMTGRPREAGGRLHVAETACIDLARSALPVAIVRAFDRHGYLGAYALRVIAIGGDLSAFPDLQRRVGINEWRAVQILQVHPDFQRLAEAYMDDLDEAMRGELDAEEARLASHIALETTYRQIAREEWTDIRDECAGLGLI